MQRKKPVRREYISKVVYKITEYKQYKENNKNIVIGANIRNTTDKWEGVALKIISYNT